MKTYTIYDNADGGFSIWYKYYDYNTSSYVKKSFYAYNKKKMLDFTKDLESKGYKFVGKI